MHSSYTLFVGICLAFFLTLSNARVVVVRAADCEGATPTLPVNGGPTELPSTNLTVAYIAIGRGVQNYTCSAAGATAVLQGAVATLFDATALAYKNEAALNAIPPLAVYLPLPTSSKFKVASNTLKVLGNHYFDAAGTPVFNLSAVGKIIFAARTAAIAAPATANKGPSGTGAVDWLSLKAKAGYTSVGVQVAYRVVTAGGVAPVCSSTSPISVQYASEYWFFN